MGDDRIIGKLENLVDGCENCDDGSEYPFDWIIEKMLGKDPSVTDYLLERPAKCSVLTGSADGEDAG